MSGGLTLGFAMHRVLSVAAVRERDGEERQSVDWGRDAQYVDDVARRRRWRLPDGPDVDSVPAGTGRQPHLPTDVEQSRDPGQRRPLRLQLTSVRL